MKHLYERVSYLKGLADGMDVESNSNEGKLLLHIIDALEDFSDAIADLKEEQEETNEYVEALDEDLLDVENEVYIDYDEEDDYDYDEDYDDEYCLDCDEEDTF